MTFLRNAFGQSLCPIVQALWSEESPSAHALGNDGGIIRIVAVKEGFLQVAILECWQDPRGAVLPRQLLQQRLERCGAGGMVLASGAKERRL